MVISQVYFSAVYDSVAIRLLGIVRLWRLLRLVDKILEDEKDAHAYTLEQLDRDRARVDDLLGKNTIFCTKRLVLTNSYLIPMLSLLVILPSTIA